MTSILRSPISGCQGRWSIKLPHYIRDRWPPLKLIVASGAAIVEERTLPVGSSFFSKPYDDFTITEAMARLLASENPKVRSL